MDLTVKIDFTNKRLDYGDGNWMLKLGSREEILNRTTFDNAEIVRYKLSNQTYANEDNHTISFDSEGNVYRDGKYAGPIAIEIKNKREAIIRYSGGDCGEGELQINASTTGDNYIFVYDWKSEKTTFTPVNN